MDADAGIEFATPREVAKWLKVSARTVRVLCERGELSAVRVGKQWRVRMDSVRELYAERR